MIYHIINRGNRRDDIFHMPKDYDYFMGLLADYSDRFEAWVYHWVIMPNHYHILLEIKDPEKLSKMLAGLARSYVYHYQRNYNIGGHIWQGRFKSQPIEKEKYLLACGRYIGWEKGTAPFFSKSLTARKKGAVPFSFLFLFLK